MTLDLGRQPALFLAKKQGDLSKQKRFQLHLITKVEGYEAEQLNKRVTERERERKERSRSKGAVARFFQQAVECTNAGLYDNNYGIDITFQEEKSLLFYVQTQIEFSLWLRAFKLIEEMNQRKIPVTLVNPFDYDNFVNTHSRQVHQPILVN